MTAYTLVVDSNESLPLPISVQEYQKRTEHVVSELADINPDWSAQAAERLADFDDYGGTVHDFDGAMLHVYELWSLEHTGFPASFGSGWYSPDGMLNVCMEDIDLESAIDYAHMLNRTIIRIWYCTEGQIPGRFQLFTL
ncbi:hypothetical protein [Bombiscardovia coagulans]|uniref:Uncharacterized protein n=1 Tax=Bombiscardovia coagulans TaxID=686666 RepID=A0A261ESL6_9BIFI|nr:hypothetical protein [Bombiscardovia coagulans]OZG49852.1 hypothetical protein BOCO_0369 [Bombiscardovia coagulans]